MNGKQHITGYNKRFSVSSLLRGLLLCACVLMLPAKAEVKRSEEVHYYSVQLQDGQSLKGALKGVTPIRKNNRHWYGKTQWSINPLYRFRQLSGSCYVSQHLVELNIVMTLPELLPQSQASEAQIQQFNRFYEALLVHEEGHKALGVKAANEVDEYLGMPNISETCETLQIRVNEEISALIQKYKQLNEQYDVETQHGKTQGAVVSH
ncbi:DUF922 domain-containing protein [Planctobacterium marinum]|uniref:DUF922 domain-containing protein n=1 Tax=Planctobacterium marinum TaxID=1631968 RepID=A0AA48HMD2_9ALTE|nr:hypothetical protein MACH26_17080 [Planctobacterium marinum]